MEHRLDQHLRQVDTWDELDKLNAAHYGRGKTEETLRAQADAAQAWRRYDDVVELHERGAATQAEVDFVFSCAHTAQRRAWDLGAPVHSGAVTVLDLEAAAEVALAEYEALPI
jgi:hypothetical protein